MPVRIEADGPVWVIVLDRPARRNAVDRAHAEALASAFRAFEADADARVAVLWGAGGAFCAGADLHAIAEGQPNALSPTGDGPMGPTRMALAKPVIAAIEGPAVAGGLELALWADLRVAADDAVLGVLCRRFGVPLIDGGAARLPRLIGLSRAMDLILTGRPVSAEEAHQIGLVNRLCRPGEARATAAALAHDLSRLPWACLLNDRRAALESAHLPLDAALALEFQLGLDSLAAGAAEGAARFRAGAGRGGAPA